MKKLPRRRKRVAARRHQSRFDPPPPPKPQPRKQKKQKKTTTSPGVRMIGIMDLPPELRVMIVRNLIHSVHGPEVYVGLGSRFPTRLHALWRFYSSVTDTMEYGCSEGADARDFRQSREQSWVQAYRTLRPLMACKTLYHEATAVFFREKHFVLGSSTYAHAWLRRIGQRNQVNLRNIRLKIHRERNTTGGINVGDSHWVEVLKKIGRSARSLQVLGFQFDEDLVLWHSTLLKTFLRMTFQNLKQIDFFHCFHPSREDSEEFLAMTAASTGCALVRCLRLSGTTSGKHILIRKAVRDEDGQVCVL